MLALLVITQLCMLCLPCLGSGHLQQRESFSQPLWMARSSESVPKVKRDSRNRDSVDATEHYQQHSDKANDDKAFRDSGCRWSPVINRLKKEFYLRVSKCYNKARWKKPQLLEVTCDNQAMNSNPENIVAYLQSFGRTVGSMYFFGDSVMHQQSLVMDCMASAAQMYDTVKPTHYISVRGQERKVYMTSYTELTNVSFQENDVIVANLGLHYQKNFSTVGKAALLEHMTHFAEGMVNLTAFPVKQSGATLSNLRKSKHIPSRPRFIWREGTTQNYPTDNGWWPYHFDTCVENCMCTKLTKKMRDGNGTNILFSPRHEDNLVECRRPSRATHDMTEKILRSHNLKICRTYDALAAAPINLHGGRGQPFDCTHYGVDALIFLNMAVINDLVSWTLREVLGE